MVTPERVSMVFLFAVSLLWALSFGLIAQVSGLGATFVAAARTVLAALVFLPFIRVRGLRASQILALAGGGALQFGLMYVLYIESYRWLHPAEVALFTIFTPLFVTLFNGRRYEGVPGKSDFRVIEFREHGIPIATPEDKVGTDQDPDTRPTAELWGSSAPEDIAQLQFRASSPIMALILTLLAVPMSRLRPRQGRYARVGFAIVVYVVYANLVAASKVWVEKGQLPPAIGVWWVHILLLGFGLYLIYREGRGT